MPANAWTNMAVVGDANATVVNSADDVALAGTKAYCASLLAPISPDPGNGNHWTFIADLTSDTSVAEFNTAPGGTYPRWQGNARFMVMTADGSTGYMAVNQDERNYPTICDSIVAVDMATMTESAPLFIGWWSTCLTLSPDEQTLVVVCDTGLGGIASGTFLTAIKIDTGSMTVTGVLPIGVDAISQREPNRAAFTPDSATVLISRVADSGYGEVDCIDVASWTLNYAAGNPTLPGGSFSHMGPISITSDGLTAWVMWNANLVFGDPFDAYVVPLDIVGNTWGTEVLIDSGSNMERLVGCAIDMLLSTDELHMYCVNSGGSSIWWRVIELATGNVLKQVNLGFTSPRWWGLAFVYTDDFNHWVRHTNSSPFPTGYPTLRHIALVGAYIPQIYRRR